MSLSLTPSRAAHIPRSLDNTALDLYMTCPRKYFYAMVLNRRKTGLTKPALAYGSCWHKILETHYKSGGDADLVRVAAITSWQEHDNPEDHRTVERALSSYEQYVARWGEHDKEVQGWGRTVGYPAAPMVEIATELSWPGALHPYTGKIDRIFEHQGLYFVEDHKSSSALGAYYFSQFDPSNQMMGYAWLAQLVSGHPIAGVRINAHGVLKTMSKFERQTVSFSPERLTEWGANLNAWVRRIDKSMAMIEFVTPPPEETLLTAFPHNFNACAGKYGQCVYSDVCTMPARLRNKVLEADFSEFPWNPLDPTGEEDSSV